MLRQSIAHDSIKIPVFPIIIFFVSLWTADIALSLLLALISVGCDKRFDSGSDSGD